MAMTGKTRYNGPPLIPISKRENLQICFLSYSSESGRIWMNEMLAEI